MIPTCQVTLRVTGQHLLLLTEEYVSTEYTKESRKASFLLFLPTDVSPKDSGLTEP